ncbi:MAG TPA: gluconate 2-dehydrogenase subunit 3 family protein, partial [Blastocatellia bacterium]|nr:gluconate 2-dehydrogenase subunit 3 family protein [Blastocatellia bacterium]
YSFGKDEDGELTRRDMIRLGASAAIAMALTGLEAKAFARAVQDKTPLFFTKEEFALVDELTELIIPADEHSPGAKAALVANYIDFRLSESFEEQPKTLWREGLKQIEQLSQEMHGKSFLASSVEERIALLTRISQNEAKPVKPEELFFRELKSRTARAYYTSEIGIKTEMEYKGNVSLKEFVGYDAT